MDQQRFEIAVQGDDGSEQRQEFNKPFLFIGSASDVDIHLMGIKPHHMRVSQHPGGVSYLRFETDRQPKTWLPGETIMIGSYNLRLIEAEPVPTVTFDGDSRGISRVNGSDESYTRAYQSTDSTAYNSEVPREPSNHILPLTISESDEPDFLDDTLSTSVEDQLFGEPVPLNSTKTFADSDRQLPNIRPERGALNAQLEADEISYVPGQRVHVPLNVQNSHTHDLDLRATVVGVLPSNWRVLSSASLAIQANSTQAFELILQTDAAGSQTPVALYLHLSDAQYPSIAVHLPFKLMINHSVSLAGNLQRTSVRDREATVLHLENQTSETVRVMLKGEAESDTVNLVFEQNNVHIAPNQSIDVPVNFEVNRRPLLRGKKRAFWVNAQPIGQVSQEFEGQVRVTPRVRLLPIIILLIVLGGIVVVSSQIANRNVAVQPPATVIDEITVEAPAPTIENPTVEAPASDTTEVESPTLEIQPTVEEPAVVPEVIVITATPQPSVLPAEAPQRFSSCGRTVPEGWGLYRVQRGDTLNRISRNFGGNYHQIATVNCISNPQLIFVGQELYVPMGH